MGRYGVCLPNPGRSVLQSYLPIRNKILYPLGWVHLSPAHMSLHESRCLRTVLILGLGGISLFDMAALNGAWGNMGIGHDLFSLTAWYWRMPCRKNHAPLAQIQRCKMLAWLGKANEVT